MVAGRSEEWCPCTNTTSILASLTDRYCQLLSGDDGVQLTLGGSCVPFSYGSSRCLQHDLLHDPACQLDHIGESVVPRYCFDTWCYVDAAACRKESHERIFRSSYFSFESGIDLFHSYSACNSTAKDWFAVEEDIVESQALGGISIDAAIPTYVKPMMYKRNNTGEILSTPGSEFYNDSIPYEGVYLNYVNKIVEISEGDIQNMTITHRSKASSLVHPQSSFTAAVQDIQDGLVDMAVGPFWITGQRLKMAAFTVPIVNDKTFLVIPKPAKKDTLPDQVGKVLAPLSPGTWGLLIGVIAVTALLSVWFSDRSHQKKLEERRIRVQGRQMRRRKRAYARLAIDSFIQRSLNFCSGGVDHEEHDNLPNKLLLLGFASFNLIAISAYVANLAAFITLSSNDGTIRDINDVVKLGVTICAHPALKAEIEVAWPEARFYFHEDGREFPGMLDDFDNNKCRVMAVGWEDTGSDTSFLEKLCDKNLVYTESIVVEIPIAFPIRPELASGLSYWIKKGEVYHGTSIQIAKGEFSDQISCNVHLSDEDTEGSEFDPILVKNMFFPLVFFSVCVVAAVLLHFVDSCLKKKEQLSFIGTRSTFNLLVASDPSRREMPFEDYDLEDEDDDNSRSAGESKEEPHQGINSARSIKQSNTQSENIVAQTRGSDILYSNRNTTQHRFSRVKFSDVEGRHNEAFYAHTGNKLHQEMSSTRSILKSNVQSGNSVAQTRRSDIMYSDKNTSQTRLSTIFDAESSDNETIYVDTDVRSYKVGVEDKEFSDFLSFVGRSN